MDGRTFAEAVQRGLSEYGVPWYLVDGASSRGTGATPDFQGLLVHHTATPVGKAPLDLLAYEGRPDLSPPLCNSAGEGDGTIAIIAYGTANHAGASGGYSMGPLPITKSFNHCVWGHEIVYPGTSPMTDAQYASAVALGAVISDVLGRPSAEWVRAHAETSVTGKWDPGYAPNKTINMHAFRQHVQDRRTGGAELNKEERQILDETLAVVRNLNYQMYTGEGGSQAPGWNTFSGGSNERLTVVDLLRRQNERMEGLIRRVDALEKRLSSK